jgi:hypothetical protein
MIFRRAIPPTPKFARDLRPLQFPAAFSVAPF